MYIGIAWTRLRLAAWGRFNRIGMTGYPTSCPYLVQSTSFGHEPEPPSDVQEIDGIVARADPSDKLILVVGYSQVGTLREKAQRLHLPKSTFKDKLDRAEWYVHQSLDCAGQNAVEIHQTRITAHG